MIDSLNKLKKVDTLFHSTETIQNLKQILESNFKVSFSRELLSNRVTLIPMVSFSNILLFESKSQVNYGSYSIGLTKEWGIRKNLHPVFYTYDNSSIEKDIADIRDLDDIRPFFNEFKAYKNIMNFRLNHDNKYNSLLQKIILSSKDSALLEELLERMQPSILLQEMLLKKIVATNKSGIEFICFNDREWRYIPSDFHQHIQNEGSSNNELLTNKAKSNEHYNSSINRLNFNLADIRFIVVDNNSELKEIYTLLYKKYGQNCVQECIYSGQLSILSQENIFHNI